MKTYASIASSSSHAAAAPATTACSGNVPASQQDWLATEKLFSRTWLPIPNPGRLSAWPPAHGGPSLQQKGIRQCPYRVSCLPNTRNTFDKDFFDVDAPGGNLLVGVVAQLSPDGSPVSDEVVEGVLPRDGSDCREGDFPDRVWCLPLSQLVEHLDRVNNPIVDSRNDLAGHVVLREDGLHNLQNLGLSRTDDHFFGYWVDNVDSSGQYAAVLPQILQHSEHGCGLLSNYLRYILRRWAT